MSKGTALITGGAIRIGRALCLHLASLGYDIALHYHTSEADAHDTARDVRALGVTCTVYQADLANADEVRQLADTVVQNHRDWRVLVHNASIFEAAPLLETSEALFDRHMNINFRTPFFLSQAFARAASPSLAPRHIISILDTHINGTMEQYFAYLLSKKSLADFTQMAARVLGPSILVNGVAIGTTEISRDVDAAYLERLQQKLPLKKLVSVADVCKGVEMLLAAEMLTGQILYVDSGESVL